MATSTGATLTPRLRLAASLNKVTAFLQQVDELLRSDFPHEDSRTALLAIRREFEKLRGRSITWGPGSIPAFAVANDAGLEDAIETYTPILGFILRSTNVRNAFELYAPIKELARRVIGTDIQLVPSSEWNFVPFTYPMNLEKLPGVVLVGGPASDSGNPLMAPIAGHEIGHSAWRRHKIEKLLSVRLNESLTDLFERNEEALTIWAETLTGDEDADPFDVFWEPCLKWLKKKTEESFCDLVALHAFGAGYIYAYEYLSAPGSGVYDWRYPTDRQRMSILKDAAEEWEIGVQRTAFGGWTKSIPPNGIHQNLIHATDLALAEASGELIKIVSTLMAEREVPLVRPGVVKKAKSAFLRRVPFAGASLPEIVVAGWEYTRQRGGLASERDTRERSMLHELMLKSIEVSEYDALLATYASRPT